MNILAPWYAVKILKVLSFSIWVIVALKSPWHIAFDFVVLFALFVQIYVSLSKIYIIVCLQITSVAADESPGSAVTSKVEPETQDSKKTVKGMW